jgi:hypothetical protein
MEILAMRFCALGKVKTVFALSTFVVANITPKTADAARYLNNSQLEYVFSDTEMLASGGMCIGLSPNARRRHAPVDTHFKFIPGGAVSIHIECLAEGRLGPWQEDETGEWYIENGHICIDSTGDKYPNIHDLEGENCWRVKEGRFGLEAFSATGLRAWRMTINKHPKHGTKEELLAALKGIEDTSATVLLAKQKNELLAIQRLRNEQEQALADLKRQRKALEIARNEPVGPEATAETEDDLWQSVAASENIEALSGFLQKFPNGRHAGKASAKIAILERFRLVEGVEFGTYHALVIGIDKYQNIDDLETAIKDASVIANLLEKEYGFKVTLLKDPDRGDIVDALDELRETLTDSDNLLIYYAGHGWQDEGSDQGYWLTSRAKPNRRSQWLSNSTLVDTLKTLQAKHVMVVADSCFSGTLVRAGDVGFETADYKSGDYWRRMAVKQTRVAMVSGGLEPVADDGGSGHSPFAKAFIDALSDNNAVIDGSALFNKLRRPVIVAAQQTPQYSDVRNTGHDGGDFLFVRKR